MLLGIIALGKGVMKRQNIYIILRILLFDAVDVVLYLERLTNIGSLHRGGGG